MTQNPNALDDLLGTAFETTLGEETQNQSLEKTKKATLMDTLTEEEQKKAHELAAKIPVGDYKSIITYGTSAQNQLSSFSHRMLDEVQGKDVGEIGETIGELMKKLRETDIDALTDKNRNFVQKMFSKAKYSVKDLMEKHQKLSTQVDGIVVRLEQSKQVLLRDVSHLDEMYDQNKLYFQGLNIYIAAAEMKRDEISSKIIPEMRKKAEASGNQMEYQEVNDMVQYLDRLEKRLYDLQLSRQITIQTAPQIRMIQQTNQTLAEKIQSSVMTSIPLWKNQISIALTLKNQTKAVEAQKKVTATTNDLLLRNSEMLKINSIETAKENERGIIEVDTLKQTQKNLLDTLEETMKIQSEGRAKRKTAELEIAQMEQDLKQRLLAISKEEANQSNH